MHTLPELIADLRRMGVEPGDTLIVHSSFKSIGGVEGGPATVVEALKTAVGREGLLALPVFTFGRFETFSAAASPSQTGAVTEVFRRSEGVVRSPHPTHSMALWGADAEEIAQAHEDTAGLDVGSPYDLAARRPRARQLMIGVRATVNSYIHVCEAILGLPYIGKVYWYGKIRTYEIVHPDGWRETRVNLRAPGCSKGFGAVDEEMKRRGTLRWERLGDAECQILNPADVLDAVRALTRRDPAALLCPDLKCGFCPEARRAARLAAR
ncbi:MAG: AAC(3) family N-acetyltransferase [Candidatus Sumerlaeota bacterium]|nr:AAC(3) family N-acetyltransferase [Candidatus Sumerlaeota bacterium]